MLKSLRNFLLTFAGFVLFIAIWSFLFRPTLQTEPEQVDPAEMALMEELRDFNPGPEDRIRINQEVDYGEGREASWYPKGESPLLRDLVEEGALPPVDERVGPEPVVMLGPEGIGNYGGTWIQARNSKRNVGTFGTFYAGVHLVRWSPAGEPVVPHLAREVEVNEEGREYIFHLRKGIRWSDGHPFTADDILYWYEHEVLDPAISMGIRNILRFRGTLGTVEKIDDFTVAFRFESPNGTFLGKMGTTLGADVTAAPAHYLRQYHPRIGDPEVIEAAMREMQMPTRRALYEAIKAWDNPEHPRMWPFLYRSYKGTPPFVWVRNPYYFAVDPKGNQLPYVDRVLFLVKTQDLIPIAAANGEFTTAGASIEHYTILMNQREKGDYNVRHFSYGGGTAAAIFPNQTKRRTPGDPDAAKKEALFRDKRFRQALSLAINRKALIEVEYGGMTEAAQQSPSPTSPFFNEGLYTAFVEYDPMGANALLDAMGLTERDAEGYRTYPDGTPMTLSMSYIQGSIMKGGMAQSIVEDWAKVGVRVIYKERGTRLYYIEREGMLHDLLVAGSNGDDYPLLHPRAYVPDFGTYYAPAWGYWNQRGGYYGVDFSDQPLITPPPDDHPLMDVIRIYDRVIQTADGEEQIEMFQEILDIAAENTWSIGLSSPPPVLNVVKNGFRNVPQKALQTWHFLSPVNFGFETYYWDEPETTPGVEEQVKAAILSPLVSPDRGGAEVSAANGGGGGLFPGWISALVWAVALGLLLFWAVRFPYIGRRLLLMIPTLAIISILVFVIIELPPGDFSTSLMAQAEAMGEESDMERIEEIKTLFHLEKSWVERYLIWSGLKWFTSFEGEDRGLLQGYLGRSMETLEPVNEVMGDRAFLTVMISLGTVLFTWVVALPIGIYSAVRQYSVWDYAFTLVGFLGMCIPNFLLALLLMYFSSTFFNISVTGLFSTEYAAQPNWSFGKFIDLLQHLWVPVVVIGTAGTASMIRVMRGNLLDELKKPYVTTARAKGVRPLKLILKYPVRLALNPFISGVGHIFPQLISGGAIVALILSLPTVGPLLLQSLLMEDMYLAGSLLMILSMLGVIGTLVSDLLLMVLDPRIRMEGGRR